jgi:hypothetical protein
MKISPPKIRNSDKMILKKRNYADHLLKIIAQSVVSKIIHIPITIPILQLRNKNKIPKSTRVSIFSPENKELPLQINLMRESDHINKTFRISFKWRTIIMKISKMTILL